MEDERERKGRQIQKKGSKKGGQEKERMEGRTEDVEDERKKEEK